jgi:hypothetical protein
MTVTAQRGDTLTSAELIGLLDRANQLAGAAGRPDLVERLTWVKAQVGGRRMTVVVTGAAGQGATSLARVLDQTPTDLLPGATFADAPGRSWANQVGLPEPGSADVVLLVSDAGHEYGPVELEALARIRAQGSAVAGVITKIDVYPRWQDVQRANRDRLRSANLDVPTIPLLPVSSAFADSGMQRGDDSLTVASGVPQLLEFLRDRIGTRVDPALRESALAELRSAVDQLSAVWSTELDAVQAAGGSPEDRRQRAVAELDRAQQLSAAWQIALGDGATELISQVDFDLRDRLREVMEGAEEQIATANPTGDWERFDGALRGKVVDSVHANYHLATERSHHLARQVAAKLAGNRDGAGVALPELWLEDPEAALQRVKPMEKPDGGGVFARVVNSIRGSYGGVLMVGVLTSLAGLSLISPWSVSAGVLLGLFTFWEDRKNGRDRGRAEARVAVAKLMDAVNFRVGDDLRTQLRTVHRTLRDHFTGINDQRLRAASDAARAAMDAPPVDTAQRESRLSEIQNNLAELRQLRVRSTSPPR